MDTSVHVHPHTHAHDTSSTTTSTTTTTPTLDGRTSSRNGTRESSHEFNMLFAKLFIKAYAPYVLLPILLFVLVSLSITYSIHISTLISSLGNSPELWATIISILSMITLLYYKLKARSVYLVDFAAFRPDDSLKLGTNLCAQITRARQSCTPRNMVFQLKVLLKSGLGDDVYGPPYILRYTSGEKITQKHPNYNDVIDEMDLMMFGALDELLLKTGIDPSQIDYLFVNVCMFYPSPSLTSHLVHRYKMREDVKTYNFSGMGCAAGMIALDLAKDLLRLNKDKFAVLVGTENITSSMYCGNDRSMLVTNCLFRCGSYALLLSNKKKDRKRSKFELLGSFRTTTAASDTSYNVIYSREDEHGFLGTSLSIELLNVASKALTLSIMKLIPQFMPFTELLKIVVNTIQRKVLKMKKKKYSLDFKKAFTHFCIHPGGKAVLEGVGKSLSLSDHDLEPTKMTLYRFGNTSSSGLWYVTAYCEAKERLKKGDKVWQVALGSGFKCNSVVWKVLRDVKPLRGLNPWMEFIDQYPVDVPDTIGPSHKHYAFLKEMEEELKQVEANEKLLQQQ